VSVRSRKPNPNQYVLISPAKQPFKIEQSLRVHVGSALDRSQAYSRRSINLFDASIMFSCS
jgi:hypothetical protein